MFDTMKTRLLLILLFPVIAYSQTRYLDSLFSVETTSDILYGNNDNWNGSNQDLYLDVYEPAGDVAEERPLIIFAHGGSFLYGDKLNPSMQILCTEFAEMGYVTASINYRLGVNYFNVLAGNGETEFLYAALRGTHDMRAAVRFFRQDADTDNLYRIDTNYIFAGGSSAGAFMGLHTAYLDQLEEIPEEVDNIEELGGIPGNSGNPGYSSDIDLAVNLSGAIGDTVWIEEEDTPHVSMHGTDDGTVPYETGYVELFGIQVYEVHGSGVIDIRSENVNVAHDFYTFNGAGHVPYDPVAGEDQHEMYMDTTIQFVKTSLYERFFGTLTGRPEQFITQKQLTAYPNPSNTGRITVTISPSQHALIGIHDMSGRRIISRQVHSSTTFTLDRGVYLLRATYKDGTVENRKLIIK